MRLNLIFQTFFFLNSKTFPNVNLNIVIFFYLIKIIILIGLLLPINQSLIPAFTPSPILNGADRSKRFSNTVSSRKPCWRSWCVGDCPRYVWRHGWMEMAVDVKKIWKRIVNKNVGSDVRSYNYLLWLFARKMNLCKKSFSN